ncbi:MAG: hypothetical protein ABH824_01420 [Nanoarchaeota archaeon]|nr:hypothetical protein [Nanoarchaeota archaeon]MBU1631752.1 hypothetical protein [Nanoarchaeota archaeon]MBU1876052.1 hypothetical protein [Nanoarchaeota archaeon]
MKRLLVGGGLIYGAVTVIAMKRGGFNIWLLLLLILFILSVGGGVYLYIKKDKD